VERATTGLVPVVTPMARPVVAIFMANRQREAGQMRQRTVAAALLMAIGVLLGWTSSAQAAGSITSYTEGLLGSYPQHIVNGPDGNLWFTGGAGSIGRITPSGTITSFSSGLSSSSATNDITVGPDGNLWFTDSPVYGRGTAAVGRITPSGTITEFSEAHWENGDPAELSEPDEIVTGPDGNLWFTDEAFVGGEPAIGRITPSGTITLFRLPGYSQPSSMVVGADGNLWFTNWGKAPNLQSIGKITPSGVVTEYLVPEKWPEDIVAGPGGALWFTNARGSIDQITTSGTITEYTTGLRAEAEPQKIVVGSEGNLWFTDRGSFQHVEETGEFDGAIGRITPSGTITEFGHDLSPSAITTGPDGDIWIGDYQHGLDRLSPSSGQLTYFWLGLIEDGHSGITDLSAGPGNSGLWFTDSGFTESGEQTGAIGKVAPVGPTGTSPLPTVDVELTNEGSGLVTSSPPGISCPGTCSSPFAPGTEVTLTETAAPGSYVLFGSVAVAGEDPCPDPVPAVARQSSVCHFTINGDALARVDFETGEAEEPSSGGRTPPGGGGASTSTTAPTSPSPAVPSRLKPKQKPLRCRKGFKQQKVHGKAKCVKSRRRRRTSAPKRREARQHPRSP
jgi:streptogramin lyase